jgi:hypothetical protein
MAHYTQRTVRVANVNSASRRLKNATGDVFDYDPISLPFVQRCGEAHGERLDSSSHPPPIAAVQR